MTCIIGFRDKESKKVFLGADTRASTWFKKDTLGNSKVFFLKNSEIMVGGTGDLRALNLLEHCSDNLIDERIPITEERMITEFIPNLIKMFGMNGYCQIYDNQKYFYSTFLIAHKDKLWQLESNFGLIEWKEDYCAVGSGCQYALGSLYTTQDLDMTIENKIDLALKAAGRYDPHVNNSFNIIHN